MCLSSQLIKSILEIKRQLSAVTNYATLKRMFLEDVW